MAGGVRCGVLAAVLAGAPGPARSAQAPAGPGPGAQSPGARSPVNPAAQGRRPDLRPGEGLAVSGPDGEVRGFGASRADATLGALAWLVWLKFEGAEWAARDVVFKCKGPCAGPKGHGRVDLEAAFRVGCRQALQAWIAASAEGWRRDYGEGVARTRLEEAFRPFLADRLPKGEGLPVLDAGWLGEGGLLRGSPESFLAWLNDPGQADLLSRCRRMLGSRAFHFKDLVGAEDWWILSDGASVVGSNGQVIAVLHLPEPRPLPDAVLRFKTLMGAPLK